MAKKNINPNQLSIFSLLGDQHDNRESATARDSGGGTPTGDDKNVPETSGQLSGNEDSGPVGIQRTGEVTSTGEEELRVVVRPGGEATGHRTRTINQPDLNGTDENRLDGTRDSGDARDQHGTVAPTDYTITSADRLGEGGAKAKFRDNIAALKLLGQLREQARAATPEEQATLVRYVGWGGLPQAFDHRNQNWQAEYHELAALLSKDEYERARRSTQDAHYTSQTVVEGIYKGLERLGFAGGSVLEPSSGTGNFIGLMPEQMRKASQFTAIELDPLTAEIAGHLYPSATIINRGYQEIVVPSDKYDVCVGNPPFGAQSLYDPDHRELGKFSIHNYFLAKSLDKLHEGGVMGVVVSRYFLDATNSEAREHIADRAHFLGAIRLPNTAFKQNALTEVTTDIVFFQKAAAGETPDRQWVETGEITDRDTGEPITLNRYFVDHPEQMAGRMAITSKMHRDAADLLPDPDADLATAIEQRLEALPKSVYRAAEREADHPVQETKPDIEIPETLKVNSYFIAPDGRIAKRLPDVLNKRDYAFIEPKNERAAERIKGMIHLRDTLRELMQAERLESSTDEELEHHRAALNRGYDTFVKRHGYISSQANRLLMSEDPEYPLLVALENNYDKGISPETAKKHGVEPRAPHAGKAAIFSRRVIGPRQEITHVESAKDALVVSMNESGGVDFGRMVRLTGKTEDDLIRDLKGLVYLNPEQARWETADQYLTGNVKAKLAAAEQAAGQNPRYIENVNALREVQPPDIEPVDIAIQLGSTWVPDRVVDQFIGHLLGDVNRRVSYQDSIGKWLVNIQRGDPTTDCVTWGTEAYPANKLIEAILTNKAIQVKVEVDRDEYGNSILVVDEEQTAAANQKGDEIRQAFADWVWEDKDRRDTLSKIYNDRFNTNVPARYDGSHLTLPGASLGIELRPHQKDAVWRGIQDGTALFDHVVGAGKTMVCIGTIMESKRMGLMKKPMVVVPNHLLLQWKDSFYSLYPNANILVADKKDFAKENRERLFGRIATGDWDAVVVAHSSFKKIGMPEDTLKSLLEEQINDLTDAILQIKADRGDRITIKEMEKAKERMEARLLRQADTGAKDQVVTFSDLGVDALFVDEAQEFKNLFITTSLNRVAGLGNLAGSEKAFDLFVKCRYLQQENNGRGVFFATGTPISNTIAELYTVQRYMRYDELKSRGVVHFDSWASTFGQVVTGWELDATGVNYKLNSRFSKFQNVPELTSLYRSFADVITKSDLDRQAEERGTRFPVPKVKGGKPQNIVVDRSDEQALFMGIQEPMRNQEGLPIVREDGSMVKSWNKGSIIYRMENLPKDPSEDNPLKITNDARKAGLDFRLINPNADDHPGSKINTAVDHIYRIWEQWQEEKGTQLVFCDLSTPKLKANAGLKKDMAPAPEEVGEEGEGSAFSMDELLASNAQFSVYDDMKAKLIARGVPEKEIRFIHEANTDVQKAKLFDDMNRGESRIMIGSTAKMGAGTNVQKRLVAEHHLDAPWRPSDLEQREGRIVRQSNQFYENNPGGFEVEILRYATKQTYDSRMWQTIEYKAAGIEQFRKGDSLQRVIEDVAGEAANAAEMKAAATGNPLIFMQVRLNADLKKTEALYSNYKRNQHSLENRIAWLAKADERADRAVAQWNKEIAVRDKGSAGHFQFTTKTKTYGEKDRAALLHDVAKSMRQAIDQRAVNNPSGKHTEVPVGIYRGFNISVAAIAAWDDALQFKLTGGAAKSYTPGSILYKAADKFSINGFTQRLDNFLSKFEERRQEAQDSRAKENAEHQKALAEKDKPFPQQQRLDLLRQDAREVMTELKLMQANDSYVSHWRPQSIAAEQSNDTQGQDVPLMAASSEAVLLATEKTWLHVPFKEKDAAKALGIKWDRAEKSWYALEGSDLTPLQKWLPGKEQAVTSGVLNPRQEFGETLRQAGLVILDEPFLDKQIYRVPVENGRPGAKDGAYSGYENGGYPGGWWQNHKTGEQGKWLATGHVLSAERKADLKKELDAQLHSLRAEAITQVKAGKCLKGQAAACQEKGLGGIAEEMDEEMER
jgi:N12 class adenine-specific DNA methylase/predicted RNA methylase